MNYWLVKSEPDSYSWDDLVKDKKTYWNGVRNFQARNNLRDMKLGDLVFFYHSNEGKEIVGIAKIVGESYPDPTSEDPRWIVIDLAPVEKLKKPVSLEEVKNLPELKNMQLVTNSRLSVQKVSKNEYEKILEISNQ